MPVKTKITQSQADQIRVDYEAGIGPLELSKRNGCSVPLIWKIIKGQAHTGIPSGRSHERPNEWPPERVRAVKDALGITTADMALRIGVGIRQVNACMQPVTSVAYRRPGGAFAKELERMEWEAAHKSG